MIHEVQLSNFMSYRNASVPLEPGLNLIIGPNGAGKSSILLAISVVLGQAYTERARKLSELIRWGEPEARISVRLDNKTAKGARPFPQARTDEVLLTRVLKRSGDYLFLLNNKPITKTDMAEGLARMGLNPDNMLVIMHQLMVGRFGSVTPVEKLLMLEDAIGFGDYRKEVLDASSRLQKLTTEREAMSSVLEGTKETYQHWQREYEKYEMKRKLEAQLKDLQRELLWRRILRKEASQDRLKDRISSLERQASKTKLDQDESERQVRSATVDIDALTRKLEQTRAEQLKLEHERGYRSGATKWIERLSQLFQTQKSDIPPRDEGSSGSTLIIRGTESTNIVSELKTELQAISAAESQATSDYDQAKKTLNETLGGLNAGTDLLVRSRVKNEVSRFKLSLIEEELKEQETQLRLGNEELGPLRSQASQLGPAFENPRDLQPISLDLAATQEKLRPLAHLSEEVEKMYKTYGDIYEDLRKKATVVEQNRADVLAELRDRFDRWRGVMGKMLGELSERYNALLSEVGGKGLIMLKASKDIEKAGLELYAGFKGNEPVSLDGLSPSGGERTIALVAFLLSLQHFISSPFRAIDEFDVHMDPRNRETVSRLIYLASKANDTNQYIAITPGQVTLPGEDNVHVIVVQNVQGSSLVKEMK